MSDTIEEQATTEEQPQQPQQPRPSRELVQVRDYRDADMDGRWRYASSLAQAGNLLPASMRDPATGQFSPGRVYLIAETGSMLGLHPVAALAGINVIEGKPAASAALMSAVIRGAGHKIRVREEGTVEGGDYKVTTTLVRSDDPDEPFSSTWTPHRAARAGLCAYTKGDDGIWRVIASSSKGNPLPWQLYTESLCKARSMSEVARDGAQDVLLGVRYTPEELGAPVDSNGEVLVLEQVAEEDAAPSALPKENKRPATGRQGTRKAPAPKQAAPAEEPAQAAAQPPTAAPAPQRTKGSDDKGTYDIGEDGLEVPGTRVPHPAVGTHSDAELKAKVQAKRQARAQAEAAPAADDDAALRAEEARIAEEAALAAEAEADMADEVVDAEIVDDGPAAVLADDGAPHPFDLARDEEPTNWSRMLAAATQVEQVKHVWDAATAAEEMTIGLRQAILTRKAEVEAA